MHIATNVTARHFITTLSHRDDNVGKDPACILLLNNANCATQRSMLIVYDDDDLGTGGLG